MATVKFESGEEETNYPSIDFPEPLPEKINILNDRSAMFRTRGYRHNSNQKMYLVQFMEEHPELVSGRYVGVTGRLKAHALWDQLTAEMNVRGPGKTIGQWQKAWTDLKSRARAKVNASNRGDATDTSQLSELDVRVIALIDGNRSGGTGLPTLVVGDFEKSMERESFNEMNKNSFEEPSLGSNLQPEMVFWSEMEREPQNSSESNLFPDEKSTMQIDEATKTEAPDLNISDPVPTSTFTRQNYGTKLSSNSLRNRWRTPARRVINGTPESLSTLRIQRRQTETLETITKVMLLNAENEKERLKVMTRSLEVNKARLKADLERNSLLKDLVVTLKGISNQRNC